MTDIDPDNLLFGFDDDVEGADGTGQPLRPSPVSRSERRQQERAVSRREHRRGRWAVLVAAVVVIVLAIVFVPKLVDHFSTADYAGSGVGTVEISIPSGAGASDIGAILLKAGAVKSVKAFTDAATANAKSADIQAGTYKLHKHMSGASAVTALLNPSSRVAGSDVVIPEGFTILDVRARLLQHFGSGSAAAIDRALNHVPDLGVPTTYESGGKFPTSAEGFLYPATYTFDPDDTPAEALQAMVSRFIQQDRNTGFARAAAAAGETPYEALIIASIAQGEAKFAQDMPKVARVILNRLAAGKALQIDATSAYGAKLQGKDPSKVIYKDVTGPYNSYEHTGLPPTPIGNPGADAMNAAVHPAAGNWLYYVNGDADGHLVFFHDDADFNRAVATCRAKHWGCG